MAIRKEDVSQLCLVTASRAWPSRRVMQRLMSCIKSRKSTNEQRKMQLRNTCCQRAVSSNPQTGKARITGRRQQCAEASLRAAPVQEGQRSPAPSSTLHDGQDGPSVVNRSRPAPRLIVLAHAAWPMPFHSSIRSLLTLFVLAHRHGARGSRPRAPQKQLHHSGVGGERARLEAHTHLLLLEPVTMLCNNG